MSTLFLLTRRSIFWEIWLIWGNFFVLRLLLVMLMQPSWGNRLSATCLKRQPLGPTILFGISVVCHWDYIWYLFYPEFYSIQGTVYCRAVTNVWLIISSLPPSLSPSKFPKNHIVYMWISPLIYCHPCLLPKYCLVQKVGG
jgi:hypothetical protein